MSDTISDTMRIKLKNLEKRKRIGYEMPQPSSEAKRKGKEKKRKLRYYIDLFSRKTGKELKKLYKEAKRGNLNNYQMSALRYVQKMIEGSERMLIDALDREEGKAVSKVEIGNLEGRAFKSETVEFRIIDQENGIATNEETGGGI